MQLTIHNLTETVLISHIFAAGEHVLFPNHPTTIKLPGGSENLNLSACKDVLARTDGRWSLPVDQLSVRVKLAFGSTWQEIKVPQDCPLRLFRVRVSSVDIPHLTPPGVARLRPVWLRAHSCPPPFPVTNPNCWARASLTEALRAASQSKRNHHSLLILPERDAAAYLARLPDTVPLSALTLPGTHDTYAASLDERFSALA